MGQWYVNVENDFRRFMELERSDLELGWARYDFPKIKYKAGFWNLILGINSGDWISETGV
jgi:hypothetical protein